MRKPCLLIGLIMLCCSCSDLPPLNPASPFLPEGPDRGCAEDPFLEGGWQLVHSIEAGLPQGRKGYFIGVSNLWSDDRSVHCVMMTLEGVVLLDAVSGPDLTINKGVPPFDDAHFARGMVDDIRLAFYTPTGGRPLAGALGDHLPVCRYSDGDGTITDVIRIADGRWEVKRYRNGGKLLRTVRLTLEPVAAGQKKHPLPTRLSIVAPGILGYELNLTLIEAQPLDVAARP